LSGIATEIAQRYGIEYDIAITNKVYDQVSQSNRTDMEVLKDLAKKEPDDIQVFFKNNVLTLNKRDLGKKPKRLFTLGDPADYITEFRPSHKGSEKDGQQQQTSAQGTDLENKKNIEKDSKAGEKDNSTGKKAYTYDEDGNLKEQSGKTDGTGKKVVTGERKEDNVQNEADNKKRESEMENVKGELTIVPPLNNFLNEIITLKNVTAKYNGNYHCVGQVLSFQGGRLSQSLSLQKDATKKEVGQSSKETAKPNNQKGDKDGEDKKEVYKYNAQGERQ
jgi:phage protein D